MFLGQASGAEGVASSFERPVDLVHLARQTLGDRSLEREILDLFAIQARSLGARLGVAAPEARADLAHTLKGSARAVGAWGVAAAAEACEALAGADEESWKQALSALSARIDAALAMIGGLSLAA